MGSLLKLISQTHDLRGVIVQWRMTVPMMFGAIAACIIWALLSNQMLGTALWILFVGSGTTVGIIWERRHRDECAMNISRVRAEHAGCEFVDLSKVEFTADLLRSIPAELVRKYRVLPVAEVGDQIAIVTSDPTDLDAIDDLHSALGREIEIRVAVESQLDSFIDRFYRDRESAA